MNGQLDNSDNEMTSSLNCSLPLSRQGYCPTQLVNDLLKSYNTQELLSIETFRAFMKEYPFEDITNNHQWSFFFIKYGCIDKILSFFAQDHPEIVVNFNTLPRVSQSRPGTLLTAQEGEHLATMVKHHGTKLILNTNEDQISIFEPLYRCISSSDYDTLKIFCDKLDVEWKEVNNDKFSIDKISTLKSKVPTNHDHNNTHTNGNIRTKIPLNVVSMICDRLLNTQYPYQSNYFLNKFPQSAIILEKYIDSIVEDYNNYRNNDTCIFNAKLENLYLLNSIHHINLPTILIQQCALNKNIGHMFQTQPPGSIMIEWFLNVTKWTHSESDDFRYKFISTHFDSIINHIPRFHQAESSLSSSSSAAASLPSSDGGADNLSTIIPYIHKNIDLWDTLISSMFANYNQPYQILIAISTLEWFYNKFPKLCEDVNTRKKYSSRFVENCCNPIPLSFVDVCIMCTNIELAQFCINNGATITTDNNKTINTVINNIKIKPIIHDPTINMFVPSSLKPNHCYYIIQSRYLDDDINNAYLSGERAIDFYIKQLDHYVMQRLLAVTSDSNSDNNDTDSADSDDDNDQFEGNIIDKSTRNNIGKIKDALHASITNITVIDTIQSKTTQFTQNHLTTTLMNGSIHTHKLIYYGGNPLERINEPDENFYDDDIDTDDDTDTDDDDDEDNNSNEQKSDKNLIIYSNLLSFYVTQSTIHTNQDDKGNNNYEYDSVEQNMVEDVIIRICEGVCDLLLDGIEYDWIKSLK